MMTSTEGLPSLLMHPTTPTDLQSSSLEKEKVSTNLDLRESMLKQKETKSSVSYYLRIVRVGGGFLTLDEFLRINVPIELEKMAQKDPISVLSRNVGKFILCSRQQHNCRKSSQSERFTEDITTDLQQCFSFQQRSILTKSLLNYFKKFKKFLRK